MVDADGKVAIEPAADDANGTAAVQERFYGDAVQPEVDDVEDADNNAEPAPGPSTHVRAPPVPASQRESERSQSKLLPYQRQMVQQLIREDGLSIMAPGLGWHQVLRFCSAEAPYATATVPTANNKHCVHLHATLH